MGASPPHIRCEGWRFVPQSFAVVHQFQALALEDAGVEVTVRDLPYFGDWSPVSGLLPRVLEDRLKRMPSGVSDDPISAVIRVAVPYDFSASGDIPTLVMATAEAGGIPTDNIVGGQSAGAAVATSDARIYAPSRWSRDGLVLSGIPEDRIDIVGHGIDPSIWCPPAGSGRTDLRQRFGWSDDFVFLNVGAMTENKGIDLLLRAFAAVLPKTPQARLVLKGADAIFRSRDLVQGYLADLPVDEQHAVAERLTYIGDNYMLDDMVALYQVADAYVSPYRAEGYNLPVLEAVACGLPVICTKGGATDDFTTSEFALHVDAGLDEVQRILVPSLDSLTDQMTRCIDDVDWRANAAGCAPEYVAEHHTWRHAAQGLLRALKIDPSAATHGDGMTKASEDDPLRLHVGGEAALDGWKVLNIEPADYVDYVGDCSDLTQFADQSVAEIYASHVLEHLGYLDELPNTLKEFHRVLKVGGRLRLSVPDLETLCRLFLHPKLDMPARFHVMRIMFGGQMDPHDFHKVGMTEEFMTDYLQVAGFQSIERVETFDLVADTNTLKLAGVVVSLNMQAIK